MYIRYSRPMNPIRVANGKVPRVKRAKREEVPEFYRKERFAKLKKYAAKLNPYLSEISLFFIGTVELIRKEISYERN